MKSTRTHAAPAKQTFPTYEEVEARLRAKYKKHTPEQREIHGEDPTKGTIMGEYIRQQCNHHSREEIRAGALRFMSRFYGQAAANLTHESAAVRR